MLHAGTSVSLASVWVMVMSEFEQICSFLSGYAVVFVADMPLFVIDMQHFAEVLPLMWSVYHMARRNWIYFIK